MNLDATRAVTRNATPPPAGPRAEGEGGGADGSSFADLLATTAPSAPPASGTPHRSATHTDAARAAAGRPIRGTGGPGTGGPAAVAAGRTEPPAGAPDRPDPRDERAADPPADGAADSKPAGAGSATGAATELTVRVDPQLGHRSAQDAPLPGFGPGDAPLPPRGGPPIEPADASAEPAARADRSAPTGSGAPGVLAATADDAVPAGAGASAPPGPPLEDGALANAAAAGSPSTEPGADPLRDAIARAAAIARGAPAAQGAAGPEPSIGELAYGDLGRMPLPDASGGAQTAAARAAGEAATAPAAARAADRRGPDPRVPELRAAGARGAARTDRPDGVAAVADGPAAPLRAEAPARGGDGALRAAVAKTPGVARPSPGAGGAGAAPDARGAAGAAAPSAPPAGTTEGFARASAADAPIVTAPLAARAAEPPPGSLAVATAAAAGFAADAAAPAATGTSTAFPITVPFGDPRFPEAIAERVTWLVREGLQSAELTLHPQDLGPIRIDLTMDGTSASIAFSAQHPDTRGAIEQSLPRLREMLAGQGLQLGGAQVDSGGARRGGEDAGGRAGRDGGRGPLASLTAAALDGGGAVTAPRAARAGRVDLFA